MERATVLKESRPQSSTALYHSASLLKACSLDLQLLKIVPNPVANRYACSIPDFGPYTNGDLSLYLCKKQNLEQTISNKDCGLTIAREVLNGKWKISLASFIFSRCSTPR
jgi:hypothetical protein